MKNKNKIQEGALDVGIQSYPTSSKSNTSGVSKSDNKSDSTSTSSTTSKSTSGFKKGARVFTNQQNLKKTVDMLKGKDVDVVVTDGVEEKGNTALEYVSEVIDESTGEISKPFTISGKNYQMVRAMGPDRAIVMGVYAFDEQDESGNPKIYDVNEFENIAKAAINELGVQEPEGPEAATLNPYPEKDAEIKETEESTKKEEKKDMKPNFEGCKHFIVNEKTGKVRKFKTIQELAKAQMTPEETYMGIKEFKKFIDSALFGKRKMKEEAATQGEVVPQNVISSVEKAMNMVRTKLTPNIVKNIQQNPVAQEQMVLAFAKEIGVPANRLTQIINGIKGMAQETKQQAQHPATSQQSTAQAVTERRIIKVKDLK